MCVGVCVSVCLSDESLRALNSITTHARTHAPTHAHTHTGWVTARRAHHRKYRQTQRLILPSHSYPFQSRTSLRRGGKSPVFSCVERNECFSVCVCVLLLSFYDQIALLKRKNKRCCCLDDGRIVKRKSAQS
jgi:hypothetical protein